MTEPESANAGAARECAAIAADLERLKVLIADAADRLLASFSLLGERAPQLACVESERRELDAAIRQAVTALQFQDMAAQLIQHAQKRLGVLKDVIHVRVDENDPLSALTRMQPVRQAGMDSGSIEFF